VDHTRPNPTTSLVKSNKVQWSDCGLAAWLAGISPPDSTKASGWCRKPESNLIRLGRKTGGYMPIFCNSCCSAAWKC
jgi:hypothetical protein